MLESWGGGLYTSAAYTRVFTVLRLTIRDAAPESYQVRPESLETFKPSYVSSKVKNENDAIRNRISDFDKRRISQPKTR